LWGLFFWQSQNFILNQLISRVKGFNHLGRFRMEICFVPQINLKTADFDTKLSIYKEAGQSTRTALQK